MEKGRKLRQSAHFADQSCLQTSENVFLMIIVTRPPTAAVTQEGWPPTLHKGVPPQSTSRTPAGSVPTQQFGENSLDCGTVKRTLVCSLYLKKIKITAAALSDFGTKAKAPEGKL